MKRAALCVVSTIIAALVCTTPQSLADEPSRDDQARMMQAMQTQFNAQALKSAEELPYDVVAVKRAIDDSDLSRQLATDCKQAIDAEAKRLEEQYKRVKDGANAAMDQSLQASMALLGVIQTKVTDAKVAHLVIAQATMEIGFGQAAADNPAEPTITLREALKGAKLSDDQRKKLDPILAKIDAEVGMELQKSPVRRGDTNDPADLKKFEEFKTTRLLPISRKAWSNVRDVLTREQRRSMAESPQ